LLDNNAGFSLKLAIISDIHSNLEALTAVLAEIDRRGVDAIYCLGDLVGYGPDPVACLEIVQERCKATVLGNHDLAVATGEGLKNLPRDGRKAAQHNQNHLSDEQRAYLAALPLKLEADGCAFAHATPGDPEAWQRLGSFLLAQEQFNHFEADVCFIGHSHMPAVMGNKLGVVRVRPGVRYLINVGSVGQPRDSDPRACVGFFDTEAFAYDLVRVTYNIGRTVTKIQEAKLPNSLGKRLLKGF
jgi:predicted phosphodiesterase